MSLFDFSGDIGAVQHPGTTVYDSTTTTYTLTGSGANMWASTDAFHFAATRATGDLAIEATIAFVGAGVNAHRKACLLFRQSLAADSAYADVALHGDGLTSLQFRSAAGVRTHEIQANVTAPKHLRLEKHGKTIRLYVDGAFSGAAAVLELTEPFYVGLGVCSHDDTVSETAQFSEVRLTPLAPDRPTRLYSTLETMAIASTDRRVVHTAPTHFEAPNWYPDGQRLLINSGGLLYGIPVRGGALTQIDTGFATRCNNDHGISPDGTQLVISDQSQGDGQSRIYTLPLTGGTPTLITPRAPSYWHGWSPDGQTLVYCAQRESNYDIYAIPATGGDEVRLTTAPGLDDGPEYSPDGAWVYFNSERTGRMQIWRMRPDGSGQEQVTTDDHNNWFAHPSPDGRWLVFLAYAPDVTGHPPNKDVALRRQDIATGEFETIAQFFGGQGTINVPCWSPDSRYFAFVTYQFVPE